jgi:hypothetical protein
MEDAAKQKDRNTKATLVLSTKPIFPAKKTGRKTNAFFIQCLMRNSDKKWRKFSVISLSNFF